MMRALPPLQSTLVDMFDCLHILSQGVKKPNIFKYKDSLLQLLIF